MPRNLKQIIYEYNIYGIQLKRDDTFERFDKDRYNFKMDIADIQNI